MDMLIRKSLGLTCIHALPDLSLYNRTVQTGEEDEVNIYQTKGKLYADVEKTHSWKERGKGTFRINVNMRDTSRARLGKLLQPFISKPERRSLKTSSQFSITTQIVMRTDGVLRLILNVAIFPEMNAVITGEKYVRFVGIEDGTPIPFLLKVRLSIRLHGHRLKCGSYSDVC